MSCRQHSATIVIETKKEEECDLSKVLFLALKPESEERGKGFFAEVSMEGEKIIVRLRAKSLSRLRAVLNSYLRWMKSISEVVGGGR